MSANECHLINCNGCVVNADCVGVVAINCTGLQFSNTDNGKIFVSNAVLSTNRSIAATGSVPASVDGQYGMFYCDATAGTVNVNLGNPLLLKDQTFFFFRMDSLGGNVTFNAFGSEKLNFAALPQNKIASQGNCISITTDGTDWFIKTSI